MLKPSSDSLPPSPGELLPVPTVDMEAEKRALFAAEEAKKQEAFLSEEARKQGFSDNAKATEEANWAAKQAAEKAALAAKQAEETAFATKTQLETAQYVAKKNEATMAVDSNQNGKSDYQEIQQAEQARALKVGMAVVGAVALTAAFADANAPRGGFSAFDSAVLSPTDPIVMASPAAATGTAAPSAAAPAAKSDAPAMGAAPSSNPIVNPANPIDIGIGLATTAAAVSLVSEAAPGLAPMGAVIGGFALAKAARPLIAFDSRPAMEVAAPSEPTTAAPVVARTPKPAKGLTFSAPAPTFKMPKDKASS